MWSSFVGFFNRDNFCYERGEQIRKLNGNKITHVVYRDNLSKSKNKNKEFPSANHKPNNLDDDKNLETRRRSNGNDSSSSGGVIRVKVTMTRAEASRLLSKCKDGGALEFRDLVNELVQIPTNRVEVMCPTTTSTTCGSILKSIPEEL